MTLTYIIPILIFTFTMSITPGPNNIMVTASGANFGFRRTIPHLLGIWVGFASILILSALGLKKIFDIYPTLQTILKFIGVAYMLFLVWKIATSKGTGKADGNSKPISFIQAVLFQIINPKAIMMAITVMSAYTLEGELFNISAIIVIVLFLLTGMPSTSLWTLFGTLIGKKLQNPQFLRLFNYTLAALTVGAAIMILI